MIINPSLQFCVFLAPDSQPYPFQLPSLHCCIFIHAVPSFYTPVNVQPALCPFHDHHGKGIAQAGGGDDIDKAGYDAKTDGES